MNNNIYISDIPENKKFLLNLIRNKENRIGLDNHDNMWYAKIKNDGSQWWASVRIETNEMLNCGINKIPRPLQLKKKNEPK